jgi:hypothetical protein
MVNEGIVLGHKISERFIEVDRAKVEAVEKMIRRCLIFSVSRCRWMITGWIICETHTNSLAIPPLPMQQIFNPMDIRDTTHLRT